MTLYLNRRVIGGVIFAATAACISPAARADVVLLDQYVGGHDHGYGDSIGGTPFTISSAVISRPDANTLQVVINTQYAGVPGTPAAESTGYGALFITPGVNAWHPTGPAPYLNDVYVPGEWKYAFVLPQAPNTTSGSAGLYLTSAGTVVLANVNGNPVSAPAPGNPGFYFRDGQAVQFTPDQPNAPLRTGTWSIGTNTITMDIVDNGLLGGDFALAWAMTCANDVIQGQVDGVPEPSTWAMMLIGFAGLGFAGFKRGRRGKAFSAA